MDIDDIYEKYFSDVYLYIRRLSGDEHIAEDITSETFFKAMRSIDRFRGECDIRVWLCQIAKNCYCSYVKKNGKIIPVEDIETIVTHAVGSAEEQVTNGDELFRIKSLLHTLPEPYKEVFMWRVFAEMDFKQIGQVFGKSDNWACVTYHRAAKMLKTRLEEAYSEK